MPTFRVYYAEREPPDTDTIPDAVAGESGGDAATEWEEQVEADSAVEALDHFFRERIRDNSQLAWVDDEGEARPVEGLDYNPDLSYIWVEDGKLMEFQGVEEATPGTVTCPLCNGHGEVDQATAAEFEEVWSEEEGAIDADVRG